MKKLINFRKWHNWVGIVISLPILIIGITTIFITFQSSYKDKSFEPQINVSWLPGYSNLLAEKELIKKRQEIRASITTANGRRFIGTGIGLFLIENDSIISFPELSGYDVHCIQQTKSTLWIGSKKGLYALALNSDELKLALDKDIHHIEIINDSLLTVSDNKSLYITTDFGKSWQKDETLKQLIGSKHQISTIQTPKIIPLHKFIIDIHTGKALFGKSFEGIWIFLVGFSTLLLTLTGIWMWAKKKFKKKILRKNI